MNRIFLFVSLIAIGMGIFLISMVLFWISYPYEPLVFNDLVFPVRQKVVEAGKSLTYISNYCKYTNLTAIVSRTFTNGLVFVTPPTTSGRQSGCHVVNIVVPVPAELPPGKYHLENIYVYQVNPIRTVVILHKTEDFEVVEAGQSARTKPNQ